MDILRSWTEVLMLVGTAAGGSHVVFAMMTETQDKPFPKPPGIERLDPPYAGAPGGWSLR